MSGISTFLTKPFIITTFMLELVQQFFDLSLQDKIILFVCFYIILLIIEYIGIFLLIKRVLVRLGIIRSDKQNTINKLKYSVERYLPFIAHYNTSKEIIHFIPYIDNILDINNLSIYVDKTKFLQEMEIVLNEKEFNIAIDYYNESSKLLSWFKLLRECPINHIEAADFVEKYMRLGIPPVQQGTYNPTVDFPYYMNTYVIPKVKQLTEEAQELINILSSKHIG